VQDIASPLFSVKAKTLLRPAPLCPRLSQLRIILRRSPGASGSHGADDAVSLLRQLCVVAATAAAAVASRVEPRAATDTRKLREGEG